jgi:hypothetical protein
MDSHRKDPVRSFFSRSPEPVVARYKGRVSRIYFRGDAAFASPDIYDYLEAEGGKYVIRLPANRVLLVILN